MISINKQGNAIVIEFTDNDKYLFNGKIEVAPNELIVVVDQSDMVTFKRASNGDVLFSQLVDDIQIAGSPVTKDTIIDQFAIIGFTSGGGTSNWDDITGKPEFAEVATSGDYNDLTNKPTIPDVSNLATKAEIADMETRSHAEATYATKQQVANKQDQLVSGTNIKTVNGQSLLGEGNIEIQGGGTITVDSELSTTSENPVQNKVITNAINGKQDAGDYALKSEIPDVSTLATKEELAAKLDTATYNVDKPTFALKTEIPNISGLATKTELSGKLDTATYNSEKASFETKENAAATYQVKGDYATTAQLNSKQDTLVSGTNIKTINGNSLLGEGDITIQAGGTVDTEMSDTSKNAVQNKVIKKYIDDLVGNILTQLQEINGTN